MPQKIQSTENVKSNLDIVYDLLGGIGVESFVVVFEGGGDSGQVEEPGDFKPAKVTKKAEKLLDEVVEGAKVSDGVRWHPGGGQETIWKENPTLKGMIDSICYETLENAHGGWEINEGSEGTFFFDVKKRKVNFDFNERIIQTNLTQYTL